MFDLGVLNLPWVKGPGKRENFCPLLFDWYEATNVCGVCMWCMLSCGLKGDMRVGIQYLYSLVLHW